MRYVFCYRSYKIFDSYFVLALLGAPVRSAVAPRPNYWFRHVEKNGFYEKRSTKGWKNNDAQLRILSLCI